MEARQELFRNELIVRLAESVENEVVRAHFQLGKYNDISVCKELPYPDVKWAQKQLEELEEDAGEELTMENVLLFAEGLARNLHQKIRTELRLSFGEMECHFYSIGSGAVEAEVAVAIRRAAESVNKKIGEEK